MSNICDIAHVGTRKTLTLLSPFLQPRQENPHAALISLFINYAEEEMRLRDPDLLKYNPSIEFLTSYLPYPPADARQDLNAEMVRIYDARNLVPVNDGFFYKQITHPSILLLKLIIS